MQSIFCRQLNEIKSERNRCNQTHLIEWLNLAQKNKLDNQQCIETEHRATKKISYSQ